VAVPVRGVDEDARDNVVGEHLPVVLPALLDVDDNHLLQPETQLREHVALHESGQFAVGPPRPQLSQVEVGGRLAVDVLERILLATPDKKQ
jgi:hypothetical protein